MGHHSEPASLSAPHRGRHELVPATLVYYAPETHCFERHGVTLCLDVLRNEVFSVTPQQRFIVTHCRDGRTLSELIHALQAVDARVAVADVQGDLEFLRTKGLLFHSKWEGHQAAPEQSWTDVWELMVNVSQTCNLRCGYCYADFGQFTGDPTLMDATVAEALVKFALQLPAKGYRLSFYGGEPLLGLVRIRQIVTAFRTALAGTETELALQVTTNGTLIDDEVANYLKEQGFKVLVSLDGPQTIHDRDRLTPGGEGSYDRVWEGFQRLVARGVHVSVNGVIVRGVRFADVVQFYQTLPVEDIKAEPSKVPSSSRYALLPEERQQYIQDLADFSDRYLDGLLQERPLPNHLGLDTKILQLYAKTARHRFCNAAVRRLGVASNGDLYPCAPQTGNPWKIGNVHTGLDMARLQAYLDQHTIDYQVGCQDCWTRYLCGGGCAAIRYAGDEPECDYWRAGSELAIYMYYRLSQENPLALIRLADPEFARLYNVGLEELEQIMGIAGEESS